MQTTDNTQQRPVRKFTQANIQAEATIISDGYRSYIPALKVYKHEHGVYNPDAGMLHWLHTMIGNGLVNICIVEKITKFDNDIFLDFRAAGKSFAGSTIRLRMACP